MKGEDEPIEADELVVRCIWTFHYKPALAAPVVREAFEPRKDETDGISVYRLACLTSSEQALEAFAEDKRDRYAIAMLQVSEIEKLGLTVVPARIERVPGHAVIPELNITAFLQDRAKSRETQKELTAIANRNIVRGPKV
jgi:hypothetical protein